jgi:hypothetical protein
LVPGQHPPHRARRRQLKPIPTIALEGTGAKIAFGNLFETDLLNLTLPDRAKDAMGTTHLANHLTTTSAQTKLIHPGQVVVEFDQVPGNPPLPSKVIWFSRSPFFMQNYLYYRAGQTSDLRFFAALTTPPKTE